MTQVAGSQTARSKNPIVLNGTALECRVEGKLQEAEDLLRLAIEIEDGMGPEVSLKRPHRRNNLATVLMRAGKLDESIGMNLDAWRYQRGVYNITAGRILFVRAALAALRGQPLAVYLGQLKLLWESGPLAEAGDISMTWDVPDVVAQLRSSLGAGDAELLARIAYALNSFTFAGTLGDFTAWVAAPAQSFDTPWPVIAADPVPGATEAAHA